MRAISTRLALAVVAFVCAAKKAGKFAVNINFQGSNALDGRLEMVDV